MASVSHLRIRSPKETEDSLLEKPRIYRRQWLCIVNLWCMFCVLCILNLVSWHVIRDDIKLILALACFIVSSLLACSLSDDTDALWCRSRAPVQRFSAVTERPGSDDIYADV